MGPDAVAAEDMAAAFEEHRWNVAIAQHLACIDQSRGGTSGACENTHIAAVARPVPLLAAVPSCVAAWCTPSTSDATSPAAAAGVWNLFFPSVPSRPQNLPNQHTRARAPSPQPCPPRSPLPPRPVHVAYSSCPVAETMHASPIRACNGVSSVASAACSLRAISACALVVTWPGARPTRAHACSRAFRPVREGMSASERARMRAYAGARAACRHRRSSQLCKGMEKDEYEVRPLRPEELEAWLDHLVVRTKTREEGKRGRGEERGREGKRGREEKGATRRAGRGRDSGSATTKQAISSLVRLSWAGA